jgi:hypothetical protein
MCIAPSRFRWLHQGRVCLKEAKSGLVCVADRKAVSALLYRPPLVQLSGRQGYSRSPFMEELAGCIKCTKSCRGIATRLDMRSRIYAPSRGPATDLVQPILWLVAVGGRIWEQSLTDTLPRTELCPLCVSTQSDPFLPTISIFGCRGEEVPGVTRVGTHRLLYCLRFQSW